MNYFLMCELFFKDTIFFFYFVYNRIQNAIDERAALGGAVRFGNLDIFVEGDTGGDRLKSADLRECHLHNDHIHEGNAIEIPFLSVLLNECTIVFLIQDGVM